MAQDPSFAYDHRVSERLIQTTDPVVIGGCGRSGTTLLLSLLSSHPRIWAIPWETYALSAPGSPPDRDAIAAALYSAAIPDACVRWCEKTPANVRNFPAILDAYGEQARVIHIVRDGRDVVTSRHPLNPNDYWVPVDRWIGDVAAGLELREHPQVLTVRYEDLAGDPRATLASISVFLGEEYSANFDSYPAFAKVRTSSAWFGQAATVTTDSVERWRAPQHAAVVRELLSDPRAVELLERLGYAER